MDFPVVKLAKDFTKCKFWQTLVYNYYVYAYIINYKNEFFAF